MKDILKYSLKNVWKRKMRSFLTVLSILIGITAIFALISFGQGIGDYIDELAKEQGTDKLLMQPRGFAPPGSSNIVFDQDDIDFIKKISGVDEASGWMITSGKIGFKDYPEKWTFVFGMGTDPGERRLTEELFAGIGIQEGRAIKKGDVLKAAVGLNYGIPNKLFKKAVKLGDRITINDIKVDVVGIYEEVGNPQDDSQVYISQEGYQEIFENDDFAFVAIRSSTGVDPAALGEKIEERFRKFRDQKAGEEDFFVQTFEEAMETFTSVIGIMNGVLVIIALISLVVAAVNIMNTMYTSILERTNEIGVMKSIGAKNRYILLVFVTESGMLGLFGGIIGVILGYSIAKFGELIAKAGGLSLLRPAFPLWLIIGCLLFAFLVGAGSGLLPAIKASKLKPVDALRYE